MKKRAIRALTGIMCSIMIMTSNGVVVLAAGNENSNVVSVEITGEENEDDLVESLGEDVSVENPSDEMTTEFVGNDIVDNEELSEKISEEDSSVTENQEVTNNENDSQADIVQEETDLEDIISDTISDDNIESAEEVITIEGNLVGAASPAAIANYLYVTPSGELALYDGVSRSKLPTEISAESFALLEGNYKITKIPAGIFDSDSSVRSIEIPNTVTEIEKGAFQYAENLETVTFESGAVITELPAEAFENCKKLGTTGIIWLPDSLTTIGEDCFSGCSGLTSIQVNSGCALTTIKKRAFDGCSALGTITFASMSNLSNIEAKAFNGCKSLTTLAFPESLNKVGTDAFYLCENVNIVDLSKCRNLTLDSYAFEECGMRQIKFSDGLEEIPDHAFYKCTRLGKSADGAIIDLEIGGKNCGVQKIDAYAFGGCTSVKSVVLNESVANVEANAFADCSAIRNIRILSGASNQEDGANIILYSTSFPVIKNLIISGYAGTVEEWQGQYASQGVKYESLYQAYPVEVTNGVGGTITPVNNARRVGELLTVQVELSTDYNLISILVNGNVMDYDDETKTASIMITSDCIRNDKITITPIFSTKNSASNYSFAISDATQQGVLEFSGSGNSYNLKFGYAYMHTQLVITRDGQNIGNWAWEFASNDTSRVTIDADGVIRTLAPTSAAPLTPVKITATLKANPNIQKIINVTVVNQAEVNDILGVSFGKNNKYVLDGNAPAVKVEGKFTTYFDDEVGQQVLQISKASAMAETKSIDVRVNAENNLGYVLDCGYNWSVVDTRVATLASTSTGSSNNRITIKGEGQTVVTATSKLADANGVKHKISFVIRVVDMTPVVEQTSITINPSSEENVYFNVISVYHSEITDANLVRKVGNGYIEDQSVFTILKTGEEEFSIGLTEVAAKTYTTGSVSFTDYYLQVEVNDDSTVNYYMKMPKLTINNVEPKPTAKLTGKINSFFTADSGNSGAVTVTVNSPKGYVLDNNFQVYLSPLSDSTDDMKFVNNFQIAQVESGNNSSLVITQKANVLENGSNNKPVVTGYITLKYVGYKPVNVKVTVPVATTKPSYILSATSVTSTAKATGQEYHIQLLNKTTKQPIDLDDSFSIWYDSKSGDDFTSYEMQAYPPVIDTDADEIIIRLPYGITKTQKAYLDIRSNEWNIGVNESLQYVFNVSVTANAPKVKFGTPSMSINVTCADTVSSTVSITQAEDIERIEFSDFVYTGRGTEGNKIHISYNDEERKLEATCNDEIPVEGTYSFKATPTATYKGSGETQTLDAITVKVIIVNKAPSIKLATSTLNLNDNLAGKGVETATTNISWTNMTQGDVVGLLPNIDNAKIVYNGVEYDYTTWDDDSGEITPNDSNAPIAVKFVMDGDTPVMQVRLLSHLSGTPKFQIQNMTIGAATVSSLDVKLKIVTAAPTLSLSAKGSINVLDSNSAVTYTVKVKNYTGVIDPESISILSESTANGGLIYARETDLHFELVPDANFATNKKLYIKVNPTKAAEIENRSYSLKIEMNLGGVRQTINVNVKPIQTMPKIKTSASSLNFYMGAAGLSKTITISPTTVTSANITDVVWATNATQQVKDAFYEPEYDPVTGEIRIRIKNPALLKKGANYTLNYVIVCKNQMVDSVGTAFSIKVNMK